MSNLNRANFNVADSGAQVNIILLSVGVGLAFACCLCVYRRCYPRYDEFTTLRNDDSDFMPILVGSPLGLLSPLQTISAGTMSFFGSLWRSVFGKRKKSKKKAGGFLNNMLTNPFMDRFMSEEARERLYAMAQIDELPTMTSPSAAATRRAEMVPTKEAVAKAKTKAKKPPLTASNYFDTEDIDIDIETTPLKPPPPLPAVPTPTAFSPTFRQYLPPAETPSPPAAGSKNSVEDYGRSKASMRDEGYPEEKASTPTAATTSSMWDWSQFTTNHSPFRDKGTVKDKRKDNDKEKERDKNKDKSVDKGMGGGLFESSRREASRLRTPETPNAIDTHLPAPAPAPAPVIADSPWVAGGGPASAPVHPPSLPLPLPLPHWKPAAPRPATVATPVAATPSDPSPTAVSTGPRPSTSDHPQVNGRTTGKDETGKEKNDNQKSEQDKNVVAGDNKETKDNNKKIDAKDVKTANDHADRAAFNAAAFNSSFYAGAGGKERRVEPPPPSQPPPPSEQQQQPQTQLQSQSQGWGSSFGSLFGRNNQGFKKTTTNKDKDINGTGKITTLPPPAAKTTTVAVPANGANAAVATKSNVNDPAATVEYTHNPMLDGNHSSSNKSTTKDIKTLSQKATLPPPSAATTATAAAATNKALPQPDTARSTTPLSQPLPPTKPQPEPQPQPPPESQPTSLSKPAKPSKPPKVPPASLISSSSLSSSVVLPQPDTARSTTPLPLPHTKPQPEPQPQQQPHPQLQPESQPPPLSKPAKPSKPPKVPPASVTSAPPVVRATTPAPVPVRENNAKRNVSGKEKVGSSRDSDDDLLSIPWLTSDQSADREKNKGKNVNVNQAKDKNKMWDSDSDKEPSSIPWLTTDQPIDKDKGKSTDIPKVSTGNIAPAAAAAPVTVPHQPISPKKRSSFFAQEPGLVSGGGPSVGGSPGKRSMAVERARQQTDLDAVTPFMPLAHGNSGKNNDNNATKPLPRRPSPSPGQGPVPDSARSTATVNPTPRPGPPPPRPLGMHPNAVMPDSARSNAGIPGRPMPPPDSARSAMGTVPGPPPRPQGGNPNTMMPDSARSIATPNPYPTPRGPPPSRPQGVVPNSVMPDSARSAMGTVPGPPPRPQGLAPSAMMPDSARSIATPTPRPAPPPPRPQGNNTNAAIPNASTSMNRSSALGGGKSLTITTTRSMDSNDDDDNDNDNDNKGGGTGSVQGSTPSNRGTPKVNSEIAEIKAARERERAEKAAKIERLKQDAIYTPKGGASASGPAPGQESDYVPLLSLPTTGATNAGIGGGGGVPLSKRQEMIQRVREDAIYTPKGGHLQSQAVNGPVSGTARGPGLPPPRDPPPSFFPPSADSATARSVVSAGPSPGPPNTSTNTIPPPRPNAIVPDSARSVATSVNPYPTPRGPPPPRPQGVAPNAMMPDSARSMMSTGPPLNNPYAAPRGPPPARPQSIVPPDSARSNAGIPGRPMPPPDSARSAMGTVPGPPPRPQGGNPSAMMPDSARSAMGTVAGPPNTNPTPRPGPPPPRPQSGNPNAMPDSARSTTSANPYPTPRGPPPPRPQGVAPNAMMPDSARSVMSTVPPRPQGPPPRPPGVAPGQGPPPQPNGGPRGPPINMFG